MPDITTALKSIRAAQTKKDDVKGLVRENDKAIGENVDILVSTCKPHCVSAAEKYNSTVSLKIITGEIRLAFDLESNTIVLKVHLSDLCGDEPDEELELEDISIMQKVLGKILNNKLRRAKIPFTLGKITVPTHYFGK